MRYLFDGCRFDASDGRLSSQHGKASVTLRPQAGRLLVCFIERPGEVLDHETLCRSVWDEGTVVDFESGLAALIRELRQALEKVGAGAELLETVPRRGYRFLGHPETGNASGESPARQTGRRRILALVSAAVVVIIGVGVLAWFFLGPSPGVEREQSRLAILPFEVYDPAPDGRRVDLLLSDSVLAGLWKADLEDLDLIGRATLRPYHQRDDIASAVAGDLGVDLIIEGSIRVEAHGWIVNARLLQMPAGSVLWSESLQWQERSDLPVQESAELLVASLQAAWPEIVAVEGFREVSD